MSLRTALTAPLIVAATLALGLAHLLVGLSDRSGHSAHRVVRLWARLVLAMAGVEVIVEGAHNMPAGPAVFVANHCSALDIPIVFGHLPAEFRVIHKRSLHLVPVVGWVLWSGGHVAIDRGRAFRARRSLDVAADRIRNGTSVTVFPEGTRSRDGSVGLFKRGSFVLAIDAGVPVVPVALSGVRELAPRGLASLRSGSVRVRIGEPVATAGRSVGEAEALAELIRSRVVDASREAA